MMSYNLYDNPAADATDMLDVIGSDATFAWHESTWSSLDPDLGALSHPYEVNAYGWERNYHANSHSFTAYDQVAHGFGLTTHVQQSNPYPYQSGLNTAWHNDNEDYRRTRNVSPNDSFSLSSSDSTFSDYALSPDVARSAFARTSHPPAEVYPSPVSEQAQDTYNSIPQLPPRSIFLPAAPILASPTACSMKEVLYTPDEESNDVVMEEHEGITITVQAPEHTEIAGVKHAQSGPEDMNQDSISIKDEEDDYSTPHAESDNDSDFTPNRASRHAQTSPLRASLRTPRRPNVAVQDTNARIHKKTNKANRKANRGTGSSTSKSTASSTSTSTTTNSNHSTTKSKPLFPCPFHPFHCPATFPSKNEWKRHTASQHLQLGVYRCDLGVCNEGHASGVTVSKGYNEFNRKDLFVQHCRRMHAGEYEDDEGLKRGKAFKGKEYAKMAKKEREGFESWMEVVRERCWKVRREAPRWCVCGICGRRFEDDVDEDGMGKGKAWEERMEHVAKHFERDGKTAKDEGVDEGLREWGIREGVISERGWLVSLQGGEQGEEEVNRAGKARGGKRRSGSGGRYGLRGDEDAEVVVDIENVDGEDAEDDDIIVVVVDAKQEDSDDEDEDTDAEGEDE